MRAQARARSLIRTTGHAQSLKMYCSRQSVAITASLAVVALSVGCGGSEATGGSSGNAGTGAAGSTALAGAGSGGLAGSGPAGSGGLAGLGGATGSSGATGSAGIPGSSGSTSSGGSPSGGTAAMGGSSGVSGATGGSTVGGGANGGVAGTASTCPATTPLTGGKQYCSNSKGNVGGGNYAYELWASETGSGCMTVFGVDANFSATWTNADDFLARVGLGFDQTKTPAQIGTISADFAETKTGNTGLVYVGIYGWTVNPLREYYILDDWGSTKPAGVASDGTPRDNVGMITVDGAVYDVWKKTRTNKPAITGDNMTFDQYFSIRQTARQCGHISISEHFSKWIGLGLQLGNLEEAKLLLEAQDSTGTIAFTTASVVVK